MEHLAATIGRYVLAAITGYIVGALPLGALARRVLPAGSIQTSIASASLDSAKIVALYFVWFYNSVFYWHDFFDFSWQWQDYLWRDIRDPSAGTFAAVACAFAVFGHGQVFRRTITRRTDVAPFFGMLLATAWPTCLIFLILWGVGTSLVRRSKPALIFAVLATPACIVFATELLIETSLFQGFMKFEDGPLRHWLLTTMPTEVGFLAICLAALVVAWRIARARSKTDTENAA